jgi:tetratricopeptide (TPR) repeat protein
LDNSPLDRQSIAESSERLDSWKEIASYLKRSVRSVQRWEAEEGMPVHRHQHEKRSTVYVFKSELDVWWRERGAALAERDPTADVSLAPEGEGAESVPGIGQGGSVSEIPPPSPRTLLRATVVGTGFALAVLLVGAVAWLSRNGSRPSAGPAQRLPFHARDWVLIAGFENRSGQPLFDGALEYALARELSNSRYVNVVPRERVGDALRLMRKPPDTPINAAVGREVCLRDGGIRALLTGRVEKLGSRYLFSVEIVDAKQGTTLAGLTQESGTDGSLAAMRRIADRVRAALGETPAPNTSGDAALAKVTTSSLRALQLYSQADRLVTENDAAAEELLRQAITEDPEFASAHVLLAHAIRGQGRPQEDFLRPAEAAYRLSDGTTERERYFIRGSYYLLLEQKEKAVAAYEALVSIYPDHFLAISNLLVLYRDLGRNNDVARLAVRIADLRPKDFDARIWATRWLSQLEPDSARASLYASQALELVSPDVLRTYPSAVVWLQLFPAYEQWLEGDAAGALSVATRVAEKLESTPLLKQDGAFSQLGNFFLTLGRLRTAERYFHRLSDPTEDLAFLSMLRDNERELQGLLTALVQESYRVDPTIGILLARTGLVTRAERVLAETQRNSAFVRPGALEAVRGELAMARGQTGEAIRQLRKSQERSRFFGSAAFLLGMETLASALANRGNLDNAIGVLEFGSKQKRQVAFYWMSNGVLWERNQLLLARLYRKAGRAADAHRIEAELLKLLAIADADHPILLELQPSQRT